ncbi:hypothetical protein ACFS07_36295 [Undibacterium arcticum]
MLLAACGRADGEYLGKWVNVKKNQKDTLEIVRNGDSYLIKETRPSFFSSGQMDTSNVPAVLRDGALQAHGGMGQVNIVHVKRRRHAFDAWCDGWFDRI